MVPELQGKNTTAEKVSTPTATDSSWNPTPSFLSNHRRKCMSILLIPLRRWITTRSGTEGLYGGTIWYCPVAQTMGIPTPVRQPRTPSPATPWPAALVPRSKKPVTKSTASKRSSLLQAISAVAIGSEKKYPKMGISGRTVANRLHPSGSAQITASARSKISKPSTAPRKADVRSAKLVYLGSTPPIASLNSSKPSGPHANRSHR
mmetsp:Transcript_1523/g.3132  ORF Transcript_1523/g.3132 Transcript_1523/m.3132 type:complete len:205 (+) Transcript_1523:638-1252(+)